MTCFRGGAAAKRPRTRKLMRATTTHDHTRAEMRATALSRPANCAKAQGLAFSEKRLVYGEPSRARRGGCDRVLASGICALGGTPRVGHLRHAPWLAIPTVSARCQLAYTLHSPRTAPDFDAHAAWTPEETKKSSPLVCATPHKFRHLSVAALDSPTGAVSCSTIPPEFLRTRTRGGSAGPSTGRRCVESPKGLACVQELFLKPRLKSHSSAP
jgi:hypothetical protein